jgi:hypothetical protein
MVFALLSSRLSNVSSRSLRGSSIVSAHRRLLATHSISVGGLSPLSWWYRYNHALGSSPILTKSITAGIIAFAADIICQKYYPSNPADAKRPFRQRVDWRRTFNFTVLSGVVYPPICHYWYAFLSTRIVGPTPALAVAKRVALDQILFAPLSIAFFFTAIMFLEGNLPKVGTKLSHDWIPTLLNNFYVWIPSQIINFSVIPPPFRVLWANSIGFFWSIYISSVSAAHHAHPEDLIKSPPTPSQKKSIHP